MRAVTLGPDQGEDNPGDERQTDRAARTLAALQDRRRQRVRERLVVAYSPLVKYVAGPHRRRAAAARGGGRPHLLRPRRPDLGDRALRPLARHQVRDLRDHAHQGRDHRRAALAGLGAAQRPRPRPRGRARQRQARARPSARAHRPGDRRRDGHHASRNSTSRCWRSRTPRSSRWTSCGASRTPAATRSR